jgi:hypothetical protein
MVSGAVQKAEVEGDIVSNNDGGAEKVVELWEDRLDGRLGAHEIVTDAC